MSARHTIREHGMSLIPALFLIIVVAALAAFAIRIGTSQRQTAAYALLGDRAYAAANSGIEWAAFRAFGGTPCVGTLALNQGALRGFRAQVLSCQIVAHVEAGVTYRVADIVVIGQWSTFGSADYVSRQVRKRLVKSP